MAPVLQCPDCGQKHPLDTVSNTPAFRCKGCGRMLKLPTELLPSRPKILKKAKMTAGAAAMMAPPMMDILPWSTSPRLMSKAGIEPLTKRSSRASNVN